MGDLIRQPIYWLDRHGVRATTLSQPAAPFTDIQISKGNPGAWCALPALVDTGCTGTMVIPQLLAAMQLKPSGKAEMAGNWSKSEVQFYEAQCCFSALPQMIMPCHIGELGLDADQPHVKALIGVDSLRHGTLVLRSPPGESYLEFDLGELRQRAQSVD